MRHSKHGKREIHHHHPTTSNRAFFDHVFSTVDEADLVCSVLLIGGSHFRHLAVRRAQAVVRYDRRSSYWSHAALVLHPDMPNPGNSIGVELSITPTHPQRQVPERNGVTLFELSEYFNEQDYPNLCLFTLRFRSTPETSPAASPKDAVIKAALNPNLGKSRYHFLEWLAEWSRYSMLAPSPINPLMESIPLPSAALVEYAFEAAGLDLTPGTTQPNACPEHLWSTLLYWTPDVGPTLDSNGVQGFRRLQDPHCAESDALSANLTTDFKMTCKRSSK